MCASRARLKSLGPNPGQDLVKALLKLTWLRACDWSGPFRARLATARPGCRPRMANALAGTDHARSDSRYRTLPPTFAPDPRLGVSLQLAEYTAICFYGLDK